MNADKKPEDFIPSFRRRKLDEPGFLRKVTRVAARLGAPVVKQLYALYFMYKSPNVPKRAKLIIVGALVYFFSPLDSIPDLLGPLGFTDDIAVIALVYAQMKAYLNEDIKIRAQKAVDELLKR